MIHDEGRLDHLFLAILFKEQIDDVAALMARFVLNVMLVRDLLGVLVGADVGKVHTAVHFDGLDHGQAGEGLFHVDDGIVIGDDRAAADFAGKVAEHTLGQFHHALVIGIGLIQLHEREFRVVAGIYALIAEHAPDLIDALQTADDEAL